jgi:hypothetical protein
MRRLIWALWLIALPAFAQDVRTYIPVQAGLLLPDLRAVQVSLWPDAPHPGFLGAQIERESCIGLKHSKCWNPYSQLKTKREWGYGLGQHTIAYRPDGSVRFNTQAELRRQYASLRGWSDDRKFDVHYQMTALIEMDHGIYRRVSAAFDDSERLAFTLSAYNGGESGVRQDRVLCSNSNGCDPRKWFGHVERTSLKSRKPNPGYGQSAYDINRGYVRDILFVRSEKYAPYFRD